MEVSSASREPPPTLLQIIDSYGLDRKYWPVFAIIGFVTACDYFDFFIVGFLVSVIGPAWHLTYGQVALILLSGGVGSIVGAFYGGLLGDKLGRRPLLFWSNILCGVSSALITVIPDGSWIIFAVLRVLTGIALGASASVAIAYIIERTPGRYRTIVIRLNLVAPSIGIVCASILAGILLKDFGWRGLAGVGAIPLVAAMLIAAFVRESVPWLIAKGQHSSALLLAERQLGRKIDTYSNPPNQAPVTASRFSELYEDRRRFWLVLLISTGAATGIYGTYLWGPSILSMVASVDAAQAARLFSFTAIAGITGKVVFSVVPQYLGRRRAGILSTGIGALSLVAAAFTPTGTFGEWPLILLCFLSLSFFLEGGFASLVIYLAEIFPVRLTAAGSGLAQAGAGAGKILGPLSLTVIAGSGDVIRPQATIDAVFPAFLMLAGCAAVAVIGLGFMPRDRAAAEGDGVRSDALLDAGN